MWLHFVFLSIFYVQETENLKYFVCLDSSDAIMHQAPKEWFNYIKTALYLSNTKKIVRVEIFDKTSMTRILHPLELLLKSFIQFAEATKGEKYMVDNIDVAKDQFGVKCADTSRPDCWVKFSENVTMATSQYHVLQTERPELMLVLALRVNTNIRYLFYFIFFLGGGANNRRLYFCNYLAHAAQGECNGFTVSKWLIY